MANSDKQIRQQLFEWFETGDRPTQAQFEDTIHSMIIQHDDEMWIEDDDADYDNYLGIGTTTPVGRLSLTGSAVIGAGWAGDRSIDDALIPDDGMLIEGGVKIGTFGDTTDPDKYKVHIKSVASSSPKITEHQRPLNIDSSNHIMAVFSDTDEGGTDPYTIMDEGNYGIRFYSFEAATHQETMWVTHDGRMRINMPLNPEARVDVNAGDLPGMKITTTNSDQLRFDGVGTTPHGIVDQSERGFRFTKSGVGERMRIANDGNVGINEPSPAYKLQVGGDVAVNPGGNVHGIRTDQEFTFYANSNDNNGSSIGLNPYTFSGGGPIATGEINFRSYGPDLESGFYFIQNKENASIDYPMLIQGDGNVGINLGVTGTDPNRPTNTLHVKGDGENTGVRLETGAAQDRVLASDTTGNSEWRDLSSFTAQGIVPTGGIIMWSGAIGNIPGGWALCNGSNGTPNLSGKFIASYSGSGDYANIGQVGGASSRTLSKANIPPHSHGGEGFSVSSSTHGHKVYLRGGGFFNIGSHREIQYGQAKEADSQLADPVGTYNTDTNTHSHTVTGSTGDGGSQGLQGTAFDNRPEYYVLAYIMKL